MRRETRLAKQSCNHGPDFGLPGLRVVYETLRTTLGTLAADA